MSKNFPVDIDHLRPGQASWINVTADNEAEARSRVIRALEFLVNNLDDIEFLIKKNEVKSSY